MSARTRWILRGSSWLPFAIACPLFAILGEPAVAIVCASAAATIALQLASAVSLYRVGFWRGRVSGLVHNHPVPHEQGPWDAAPAPTCHPESEAPPWALR